MQRIERTGDGRIHRQPDLFLSHSSRDKDFVRRLAEDLTFCEVDVWLDEWELQAGDSLHDLIGNALEKSRFIGVVLGDNFSDSRWARDELKQALSRERRSDRIAVLPLLCGNCPLPAFLEDKLYIDFRIDYFAGVVRLAARVHGVSSMRVEDAVRSYSPRALRDVINALRYCGVEPYIVLGEDDFREIAAAEGALSFGERVRFSPERVRASGVSPRIQKMMTKLIDEAW
jgi:TIR domain